MADDAFPGMSFGEGASSDDRVAGAVQTQSDGAAQLRGARAALLVRAAALMAAASGECRRASPKGTITLTTDPSGRLLFRCDHDPVHQWDVNGNPLP